MSDFDVQGFLAALRGVDSSALATPHAGLNYESAEIAGLPAEWTLPEDVATDPEAAVMYLHGGGYVAGSPDVCRLATSRIALGLGVRVIAPDYRLAPEHPFPAAHEDVLAVYRELIAAQGVRPEKFAVAGDSAGASLAVSLIADARESGLPMPACGTRSRVPSSRRWSARSCRVAECTRGTPDTRRSTATFAGSHPCSSRLRDTTSATTTGSVWRRRPARRG